MRDASHCWGRLSVQHKVAGTPNFCDHVEDAVQRNESPGNIEACLNLASGSEFLGDTAKCCKDIEGVENS